MAPWEGTQRKTITIGGDNTVTTEKSRDVSKNAVPTQSCVMGGELLDQHEKREWNAENHFSRKRRGTTHSKKKARDVDRHRRKTGFINSGDFRKEKLITLKRIQKKAVRDRGPAILKTAASPERNEEAVCLRGEKVSYQSDNLSLSTKGSGQKVWHAIAKDGWFFKGRNKREEERIARIFEGRLALKKKGEKRENASSIKRGPAAGRKVGKKKSKSERKKSKFHTSDEEGTGGGRPMWGKRLVLKKRSRGKIFS